MPDEQTIFVECPSCQAGYELSVSEVGQTVECACEFQFVVPQPARPAAPSVTVVCPSCESVYELESEALGDNVECQCGTVFTAVEKAPVGKTPVELATAESTSPAVEDPSPATPRPIHFTCPACSGQYELEAELAGQEVECACGNRLLVPAVGVSEFAVPEVADAPAEAPASPVLSADDEEPPELTAAPQVAEVPADPPAPAAKAPAQPAPPASPVTSKLKQKSKKKTPPSTLWIGGGCTLAAVALLAAFLMSGEDDTTEEDRRAGRPSDPPPSTASPSEAVAATDSVATASTIPDGASTEKPRQSLADRMRNGPGSEETSVPPQADPEGVAPSGSGTKSTGTEENPATPGEGSANPNELTKKNDFVLGGKPAPKPAASKTIPGKPVTVTTESAAPEKPAKPAPPRLPPPKKRIAFVTPERTYRRFKDSTKASFKMFSSMRKLKKAAAGGAAADVRAFEDELAKTGGLLKSTLRLVDVESDPERVIQMRLLLAYCYLEAGQLYEAGILSHAVARWTPPDMLIEPKAESTSRAGRKPKPTPPAAKPATAGEAILAAENAKARTATADVDPESPMQPALESAQIALAAFVKALDAAPEDDRTAEIGQIVEIATLFDKNWPDHEKCNSIRVLAGQLLQLRGDRLAAADWYGKVSKGDADFARSRLLAGQACWSAHLEAVRATAEADAEATPLTVSVTTDVVDISSEENVSPGRSPIPAGSLTPQLLKQRARQYLEAGVEAGASQVSLRENVIVAKLTLAQLHLGEDRFEDAVAALADEPSVTAAIGEGSEGRPARGIRSVGFSKIAYTTLIRAHLGAGQLDEARTSIATLQTIAGSMEAASLARLHLDLSAEMTASYLQLAKSGEQNIELLTTIATSLEQVVKNASAIPAASLLKAATAATELAGAVTALDDAKLIYGQAASLYQALLATELPNEGSETAVRFRLAEVSGKAGRFEESLKLYDELLSDQPNVFEAQVAAAAAMQAWGVESKEPRLLVHAIIGEPDKAHLWGWAKLSLTMQRLLAKDASRDDYRSRFLTSRLHIAECRLEYSRLMSDPKKKASELDKALRELGTFALTMKTQEGPEWQALTEIFQEIQKELGRKPTPLPQP
jgi:tetratricopeptide (TPR) repeat protein